MTSRSVNTNDQQSSYQVSQLIFNFNVVCKYVCKYHMNYCLNVYLLLLQFNGISNSCTVYL
jgi:hypothetical protein